MLPVETFSIWRSFQSQRSLQCSATLQRFSIWIDPNCSWTLSSLHSSKGLEYSKGLEQFKQNIMFSGLWLRKFEFAGCQAEQLQMKDLTSLTSKTLWSTHHVLCFQTLSALLFLWKRRERGKKKRNKTSKLNVHMKRRKSQSFWEMLWRWVCSDKALVASLWYLSLVFLQYKPLQSTEISWKVAVKKKKQTETLWCLCLAVSMSDADKLKDKAFKNPLASPSQTCTSVWPGRLFGIGKKAGQKEVFFVRYISAYPSPRRKYLWTNVIYSLTKSHAYSSKVAPSVLLMLDCAKNRSGFIGCQRQLRQKKGSLAWHDVHGWMQGL